MSKIVELENSVAASCLLLPRLQGIDVCSFELTDDVMSDGWPGGDQVNTNSLAGRSSTGTMHLSSVDDVTGISSEKTVRLILLFLTNPENSSDQPFADALLRRYGCTNTVVAGGYGYNVITDETRPRCGLLLFPLLSVLNRLYTGNGVSK
jgi:hypothetical protein